MLQQVGPCLPMSGKTSPPRQRISKRSTRSATLDLLQGDPRPQAPRFCGHYLGSPDVHPELLAIRSIPFSQVWILAKRNETKRNEWQAFCSTMANEPEWRHRFWDPFRSPNSDANRQSPPRENGSRAFQVNERKRQDTRTAIICPEPHFHNVAS